MRKRSTKARSGAGAEKGRTDWKRIDALSDRDIARAIEEDSDTFDVQPEWLSEAVIVHLAPKKQQTTIRFDEDLLEWFRAQGEGYQTRMNAVLRAYYEAHRKGPERKSRKKN